MAEERVQRRLAAILAADVVGYSRLMGEDEVGTLAALMTHREALIDPKIAEHQGRIVKTTGDGMLVEFPSVVEAVLCAVEIQKEMSARNAEVPEDRKMLFRIGINIGDIIIEGDDIYGDGVNVAARLEGLAEPGGICIRRAVRNQVRDKLPLVFEDMGEVEVKNIARPVRVFRVLSEGVTPKPPRRRGAWPPSRVQLIAGTTLVLLIAAGSIGIWLKPRAPGLEPASVEVTAPPLPDRPSIAVLPFNNMSDDPGQDYFTDGMTEDLITDLAKLEGLFVIARNSTFAYKGKAVDIKQVGRELGVKYVLEGSVRRVDDRIRINVQLINTLTGGHVWADRYDDSVANVFAVQDKVVGRILQELAVRLTPQEQEEKDAGRKPTAEAHDSFLRGWAHFVRATPEHYANAVPYFEEAIRRDPEYGRAYAALATVYWTARLRMWHSSLGMTPDDALEKTFEYLELAEAYPTPLAHQVRSRLYSQLKRHDDALAEAERALALNPNDPAGHFAMASALIFAGRPAEGTEMIRRAMRLDPHFPPDYLFHLGIAQFNLEQYPDAVATLKVARKLVPDHSGVLTFLVAAYGQLEQPDNAAPAIAALRELTRSVWLWLMTITVFDADIWPFQLDADRERLREGLRKGGMPEFAAEWDLPRENRLSGKAVKEISFGHTQHGRHPVSGLEFTISRTADGQVTAKGMWNDTGQSRIIDDRICNSWTRYSGSCAVIYRNPGGTKENGDDFLLVQRSGVFPFTIAD